jgi:hypothetical protein
MITTDEIEELIVRLHNEHKTTREISKFVHKNFSYVGAVLRKRFPEEYPNENKISKETQALKLFTSKKTPTQVAIELDEKPDSVETYFSDFWRLESMQSLYNIYLENKKIIPNLLRLYKLLKKKNISPRDYRQVFDLIEKQVPGRDEHESDTHVYTLDELERGFPSDDYA